MPRTLDSEANVRAVAFLDGGAALAGWCSDRKARVWDTATGRLRETLERASLPPSIAALASPLVTSAGGALTSEALIANKQWNENTVRVRDRSGADKFRLPAGLGGVSVMTFSPGGQALAAGSYDTSLRVWNTANGELLRHVEELPVSMFAMDFSPDGRWLAAAGADRIVYVWDATTWRLARKLSGQPEMISALAFSSDGRRLATGGFSVLTVSHPVKILLWDFASGKPERTFDAPSRVNSLALSPDGRWLAAAFGSRSVVLHALA